MPIAWFDTTEIDRFAEKIASDFMLRFPASEIENQRRKGSSRLQKARDAMFSDAEKFAQGHRMNVYKKARLGNRFKWKLREAGYPKDFIDSLTYDLTVVTVKSARAKQGALR